MERQGKNCEMIKESEVIVIDSDGECDFDSEETMFDAEEGTENVKMKSSPKQQKSPEFNSPCLLSVLKQIPNSASKKISPKYQSEIIDIGDEDGNNNNNHEKFVGLKRKKTDDDCSLVPELDEITKFTPIDDNVFTNAIEEMCKSMSISNEDNDCTIIMDSRSSPPSNDRSTQTTLNNYVSRANNSCFHNSLSGNAKPSSSPIPRTGLSPSSSSSPAGNKKRTSISVQTVGSNGNFKTGLSQTSPGNRSRTSTSSPVQTIKSNENLKTGSPQSPRVNRVKTITPSEQTVKLDESSKTVSSPSAAVNRASSSPSSAPNVESNENSGTVLIPICKAELSNLYWLVEEAAAMYDEPLLEREPMVFYLSQMQAKRKHVVMMVKQYEIDRYYEFSLKNFSSNDGKQPDIVKTSIYDLVVRTNILIRKYSKVIEICDRKYAKQFETILKLCEEMVSDSSSDSSDSQSSTASVSTSDQNICAENDDDCESPPKKLRRLISALSSDSSASSILHNDDDGFKIPPPPSKKQPARKKPTLSTNNHNGVQRERKTTRRLSQGGEIEMNSLQNVLSQVSHDLNNESSPLSHDLGEQSSESFASSRDVNNQPSASHVLNGHPLLPNLKPKTTVSKQAFASSCDLMKQLSTSHDLNEPLPLTNLNPKTTISKQPSASSCDLNNELLTSHDLNGQLPLANLKPKTTISKQPSASSCDRNSELLTSHDRNGQLPLANLKPKTTISQQPSASSCDVNNEQLTSHDRNGQSPLANLKLKTTISQQPSASSCDVNNERLTSHDRNRQSPLANLKPKTTISQQTSASFASTREVNRQPPLYTLRNCNCPSTSKSTICTICTPAPLPTFTDVEKNTENSSVFGGNKNKYLTKTLNDLFRISEDNIWDVNRLTSAVNNGVNNNSRVEIPFDLNMIVSRIQIRSNDISQIEFSSLTNDQMFPEYMFEYGREDVDLVK